MCGLAMLYSERASPEMLQNRLKYGLTQLTYRGPDENALWHSDQAAIGHCRLSIIDLSDSQQPMTCPNNRFVLAFNGEIYNYRELRLSLSVNWTFRTNGDTEVLLAGLLAEGEQFLKKMKGMWAFVFWDKKEKDLLVSRDRFGKKPLFFANYQNELIVASEISALKRMLNDNCLTEDLDSTADYLRTGVCLPGHTFFREVGEILPGHFARWKPGLDLVQNNYWQLQVTPFLGNAQEARSELQGLLKRAVSSRTVADVEVGAFLSGGIDSSLLASILVNDLHTDLKTFTIGFSDSRYDESQYAARVAKWIGTDHHVDHIDVLDVAKLESLVTENVAQPFADPSLLPTALVSEVAARHVKVAISGDGADEVFSGYQRYQAMLMFRWYLSVPKSMRAIVSKCISYLPSSSAHHSRSVLKKAQLFVELADRRQETPEFGPPQLASRSFLSKLAPDLTGHGHALPPIPSLLNEDDVYRMMLNDMSIYLPQDILVKVDRASMSNSLEVRSPFLDHEIVEFAFSLPRNWHRSGMLGKKMLRSAFSNYLPKDVWRRKKQGFSIPISEWFLGSLGDRLMELLNCSSDTVLDRLFIKKTLAMHRSKQSDFSMILWAVYVYLIWRQKE